MKTLSLIALMTAPLFSAVTSLPTAPTGFTWQLVTSGQLDSSTVNVSAVESTLEGALGLSGSSVAPYTVNGMGSTTADLTAFGTPEPASYSLGDTVDLVTANTYAATLTVSNTAGVQNGNTPGFLVVESKLSGVQITSSLGASAPGSDVTSAAGGGPIILVAPNASASAATGGSFTEVEGEIITFTFAAADELAVTTPFGGATPNLSPYFVNSTASASLRRDTEYDTYELVEIVPEPSSVALLAMSALGLMRRRRS